MHYHMEDSTLTCMMAFRIHVHIYKIKNIIMFWKIIGFLDLNLKSNFLKITQKKEWVKRMVEVSAQLLNSLLSDAYLCTNRDLFHISNLPRTYFHDLLAAD